MIMVDQIMQWAHARGMFKAGSCHMTTDGPIGELHAFAKKVGLGRHLFHNVKIMPHYDLTIEMRQRAIDAGAREVDWREQRAARLERKTTP